MKKCLIVDDVEVTRFTTEQILVPLGVEALTVSTPEEALAKLEQVSVDAVLLDWHLRKNSGLDLISKIKELGRAKIVVFSGVEGQEKRNEALQSGADAFLEKPTTKEKLEACLKGVGIL
jgi:CheY-like chemotaxis protein